MKPKAVYLTKLSRGLHSYRFRPEFKGALVPIRYHPRGYDNQFDHVHQFLEYAVVLSGQGMHRVEGRLTALRSGDVVVTHNGKPHAILPREPPDPTFTILNLCFLPEVLGYPNEILKDPHLAQYYEHLAHFHQLTPEGSNLILRPSRKNFRAIAALGEHLFQLFHQSPAVAPTRLHALFREINTLIYEARPAANAAPETTMVQKLCNLMDRGFAEPLTLSGAAKALGANANHLSTQFHKVTGRPFGATLLALRLAEARRLLTETKLPVTQVALRSGFINISHFNVAFRKASGTAPTSYRKNWIQVLGRPAQ